MGIEAATAFLSTPAQLSPAIAPTVLNGLTNVVNYGFSIPPGQYVAPGIATGVGALAAGEVLGYGASALAATLFTPEVLAVAGTLAIGAMIAATVGALSQSPNSSVSGGTGTGSSDGPVSYGVAGKFYHACAGDSCAPDGFAEGPLSVQFLSEPVSYFGLYYADLQYKPGLSEVVYFNDPVPPPIQVFEQNAGVVQPNSATGQLEQTQSPEKAYAEPLRQQLPGYPTPKGVGDPVAGKAPQRSTVPAPDGTPLTRTAAPGNGATVDTKPGTGTTTAHDPGTGKTKTITPDPKTAEGNKGAATATGVGLIPTDCPDPCAPPDFSAVLEAIANVKKELDLVTDRIGFQSASVVTQCGSDEEVTTIQQFFEIVDGKLGFEDALLPPDGVAGTDEICSVSDFVDYSLGEVPTLTIVQGFEVNALRSKLLTVFYSARPTIVDMHYRLAVAEPITGLSAEQILAACPVKIPGDWLCSVSFADGRQLQGWFTSEAAGIEYLRQAAILSTLALAEPRVTTATHRPGAGPDLQPGSQIYPVKACVSSPGQGGGEIISFRLIP